MVVCTHSQSALATLQGGPLAQTSQLGIDIRRAPRELAGEDRQLILQWVPSHCGLDGNERVDKIAKDASSLSQENTDVDVQTAHHAAARLARSRTTKAWPAGWYRSLMGRRLPPPAPAEERSTAVDVQLQAGHWSGSAQWRHRVGQSPSRQCQQCARTAQSRPLRGVPRGGGHTTTHLVEMPDPDGHSPPAAGHHQSQRGGRAERGDRSLQSRSAMPH